MGSSPSRASLARSDSPSMSGIVYDTRSPAGPAARTGTRRAGLVSSRGILARDSGHILHHNSKTQVDCERDATRVVADDGSAERGCAFSQKQVLRPCGAQNGASSRSHGGVSSTDRRRPDPGAAARRESHPALRAGRQRGGAARLGRVDRGGHVRPAHTDTDVIVRFEQANVLHAGDVFFNGRYPYIDGNTGGRVDGMIEGSDRLLRLADADTKIVPGHGALATRADLVRYRDMLATAADRVRKLKASGKSLEESIAAKPFTDLDGDWGTGRFKGNDFVKIVYLTL